MTLQGPVEVFDKVIRVLIGNQTVFQTVDSGFTGLLFRTAAEISAQKA